MKIAYVITRSDEVGGAHIHVRDLASWLQNLGHEVRVFVGGKGPYLEVLQDASLPYQQLKYLKRPISPMNDLRAVWELAQAISHFKPDIVSAHSAKAGMIARIACGFKKIPCIFTAHGWSFTEGVRWPASLVFRSIERLLAPASAAIITVCENDRAFALEKGIASPKKLRTIHNGMPEVDESSLDTSDIPGKRAPVLVMVARFEKQKDHRTLISALGSLKDLGWHLQLVGDGPLLDSIKTMAEEKGIADRIEYLGRRRNIPEILQAADIFVLSTNWEGFPRSILEAMRAGLPVVATRVAGIPEAVRDSETGYLVPLHDDSVLSEKIRKLVKSQPLREKFGQKGKARFLNEFTFERMAIQTLALYQELLSRGSGKMNE